MVVGALVSPYRCRGPLQVAVPPPVPAPRRVGTARVQGQLSPLLRAPGLAVSLGSFVRTRPTCASRLAAVAAGCWEAAFAARVWECRVFLFPVRVPPGLQSGDSPRLGSAAIPLVRSGDELHGVPCLSLAARPARQVRAFVAENL